MVSSLIFSALISYGASTETYVIDGKSMSRIEAVKTLLSSPNAEVNKCYPVILNDKLSLIKKK